MVPFEIRRVRSGVEETFVWLTLWYRADPKKLDVLHIVVTAPEHRDKRLGSFYMEGHDQSVACYGGAERVAVGEGGIKIRLNAKGMKALSLDREMTLVALEKLSGWKKALKLLQGVAGAASDGIVMLGVDL